jgi:hypothetical protein
MLILAAMRGMTPQVSCSSSLALRPRTNVKDLSVRAGNIGLQVAEMCTGLGMTVIYTGRSAKQGVPFEFVPLEELLGRSDCVVLTCLLNKETEGLMNAERFGMMKEDSVLVNVCEFLERASEGKE